MIVRYKQVTHERVEDAPFVGALISAVGCSINCAGCFNQHLKDGPTIESDVDTLIATVIANPFNEGVILGGLEWTDQPDEMMDVIGCAKEAGLHVMLYTGLTLDELLYRFPELKHRTGLYVKSGAFVEEAADVTNIGGKFGVALASRNQQVNRMAGD